MRWPVKTHKNNETRAVKKFAWFPTRVQNEKVWLEAYYIKQVYYDKKWQLEGDRDEKFKQRYLTLRAITG